MSPVFVVSIGLCLATDVMAAEDQVTATLEWEVPDGRGCLGFDGLKRAVEARLGRRVFVTSGQGDIYLHGVVAADPTQSWSVTLTLRDPRGRELGTRQIRSRSKNCAALADTLPVVVALLIDLPRSHIRLELPEPTQLGSAPARDSALRSDTLSGPLLPPPPPLTPPPQLPSTSPSPARQPEAPPRSWSFGAALMGQGAVGLLPRWGWGMAMSFDVHPPGFPLFSAWVSELSSSTSSGPREEGVLVSMRTAGLLLCPPVLRADMALDACLGMAMGETAARGMGYDENLTASALYWALEASVRLRVPVYKTVGLGLNLMADLPLRRPRFVGEASPGAPTEIARVESVGGRIDFGLALRAE